MKTSISKTVVYMFVFALGLFYCAIDPQGATVSGQATTKTNQTQAKPAQTNTKSTQTKPKPTQATKKAAQSKPVAGKQAPKTESAKKPVEAGTVTIGSQTWSSTNLNVATFSNGDTIPEAKTFQEWVAAGQAGKPACCYYNNDPANGPKYGRLYNWYAVIDPRGLAPKGWALPTELDWAQLIRHAGGSAVAGTKLKTLTTWTEGYNGTNELKFNGMPAGYRIENGTFQNLGTMAVWWSTTEVRSGTAVDYFLSMSSGINRSINPKQRGESVRCIKK